MKRKNVALMLVLVLLMAVTTTAYAETATVIADALHLRDAPQGTIVGSVKYGETVTIVSGPDRNHYYYIYYNGGYYYVYGQYLDFTGSATVVVEPTTSPSRSSSSSKNTAKKKEVEFAITFCYIEQDECQCECKGLMFVSSEKRLALRSKANLGDTRIGWLSHGEPVMLMDTQIHNGFVKVCTLDGRKGYAYADFLSPNLISDMMYLYELCEDNGCCDDAAYECWCDVSWFLNE